MELMAWIRLVKRLFCFSVLKVKPGKTQLVWCAARWWSSLKTCKRRCPRKKKKIKRHMTSRCHAVPCGATWCHISTGHHWHIPDIVSVVTSALITCKACWCNSNIFEKTSTAIALYAVQRLAVPCSTRIWSASQCCSFQDGLVCNQMKQLRWRRINAELLL